MSNRYAQKLFSFHPIAMWSGDDNVCYQSCITEAQRRFWTGWTIYGGSATEFTNIVDNKPFEDTYISKIVPTSKNLLTSNQATVESGDTTGWVQFSAGTLTADTTSPYQGTYCIKDTFSSGRLSVSQTSKIAVTAGKRYYATARIKADAGNIVGNNDNVYLIITWYDSGGSQISNSNGATITATTSWQEITASGIAPVGAAKALVLFYRSATVAESTTFYIDAVGLYQGDSATYSWDDPGSTPANVDGDYTIDLTSTYAWNSGVSLESNVPTSASFFMYVYANSVDYVDFGSTDGTSESLTRNYFPEISSNTWIKVSSNNLQYNNLLIRIKYKDNQTASGLEYLLSGLTVGQYSEPLSSDSLGIAATTPAGTENVITSGALPGTIKWHEEKSSGVSERSMYYSFADGHFLASNSAMPMVYGSNYLTRVKPVPSPHEGEYPSLTFDGCGMFNSQGRYDTFTLEFWLRVGGGTITPRKILGPAISGNEDGLYICGSAVIVSVGNERITYNVGRWGDPMLFHIVYTPSNISLLINGETVAEKQINSSTITLPAETNQWWGFYSYEDIDPLEIDIVSLFGYAIPGPVAKRRFVWGQGVGEINLINSQYQGDGAFASFSASNITNSVSYPDNATWAAGSLDNLTVTRNRLAPDTPKTPEVVLTSHTKQEWLDDLDALNTGRDSASHTINKLVYLNYRPNSEYDAQTNYAMFDNPISFCKDVAGMTATVNIPSTTQVSGDKTSVYNFLDVCGNPNDLVSPSTWASVTAAWPVLTIRNKSNPSAVITTYCICLSSTKKFVTVYADSTNSILEVLSTSTASSTSTAIVYKFAGTSTSTLATALLRDLANVQVFIGSDTSVSGNVNFHSFGFFNNRLYNERLSSATGLVTVEHFDQTNATAVDAVKDKMFVNYTYFAKQEFGAFYEDYGIRGSWEDYVPLASLAGVVKDANGNDSISLDAIQYNVSYPAPEYISPVAPPSTWTYAEFADYYEGLTLAFLYMGIYSGYETYGDLKNQTSFVDIADAATMIDTSGQFVRSFVSLQKGSSYVKQASELEDVISATNANTVYFQAFDNADNTLFEIYDGAILVPPRSRAVDKWSLVVSLEYSVPGILTYPVEVKSLELAATARNRNDFTPIKASSGKDLYPIVTNGVYYDNSAYNPIKVDKRALPYLYLGNYSGFTPMGPAQNGWDKGLQMIIPETKDPEYKLDNIQFWTRTNRYFPVSETTFAKFEYDNGQLLFTVQSYQSDKKRGIVKVYSSIGVPFTAGKFVQNGNLVSQPILEMNQWHAMAFAFENTGFSTGGSIARMTFFPGMSYNNMSYFSTKASLGSAQVKYRSWTDILAHVWSYWRDGDFDWADILVEGTAVLKEKELSQIVYRTYIGTEQISVEAMSPLTFKQDSVSAYSSSSWSNTTIIPV